MASIYLFIFIRMDLVVANFRGYEQVFCRQGFSLLSCGLDNIPGNNLVENNHTRSEFLNDTIYHLPTHRCTWFEGHEVFAKFLGLGLGLSFYRVFNLPVKR